MIEQTTRDRIGEAVLCMGIGALAVGIGIAAVVTLELDVTFGTLWLVWVGLGFLALGLHLSSRKVTYSDDAVRVSNWLGVRTARVRELQSVQIKFWALVPAGKPGIAFLVARDRHGLSLKLIPSHLVAVREWLAVASDAIVANWKDDLAAGRPITFGRRTRLTGSWLESGRKRIDLSQRFTLELMSGGPAASVLRVACGDERIDIDGDLVNFHPLVHYLRQIAAP